MSLEADRIIGMHDPDLSGHERIGPVTPGDVVRDEFMRPLGLPGRALTRDLGIPSNRVMAIAAAERAVSAHTAILLGNRFDRSAEFWLNLQMAHDPEQARRQLGQAA